MGDVRALDYKGQYKMCYAFYDEIIKYPRFDENKYYMRFDEIYESINPDWLDEEKDKIRQCVEVMCNALSEIEKYDSDAFIMITKNLSALSR